MDLQCMIFSNQITHFAPKDVKKKKRELKFHMFQSELQGPKQKKEGIQ